MEIINMKSLTFASLVALLASGVSAQVGAWGQCEPAIVCRVN